MEPRKTVEQFEVIERQITESRRPISPSEAFNYVPTTTRRNETETFMTCGAEAERVFREEADRRYQLTGERDASRDASFGPTGEAINSRSRALQPSTRFAVSSPPYRDAAALPALHDRSYSASGINNYGYDIHEVHTSAGGARIVSTHGSGGVWDEALGNNSGGDDPIHERSVPFADATPPFAETLIGGSPRAYAYDTSPLQSQSILKTVDLSRQQQSPPLPEESSLTRKDSYKRMQENADAATYRAPSSNATIISRASNAGRWAFEKSPAKGDDTFCGMFRGWCEQICYQISAAFSPYSVSTFLMYPPVCQECIRRNPAASSYRPPSKLYVHVRSPSELEMEMVGNQPLKSNSYTLVDFTTGFAAIADHALTDTNGRHTTCFLMKLDHEALPSMDVAMEAIANTYHEVHSQVGWAEHWQFAVREIDAAFATSKFHSTIQDCVGAHWYMLEHTTYTKDASCTSCYDFCLPDYAVERRQKYEDGVGLTIRRLNCFRHYVPEWINGYSIESDEDGGHFGYPRRSADTQRDENNNWVDWKPISVVGRPDNTRRRENYRGDVDGGGVGGGGGGVIDELTGANSDLFAPVDSPRRRVHVD